MESGSTPRIQSFGCGRNVMEALDEYIRNNPLNSDQRINTDGIPECGKVPAHLSFTAIALDISDAENKGFLKLINTLNSKWLPVFAPFFDDSKEDEPEELEEHSPIQIDYDSEPPIIFVRMNNVLLFSYGHPHKGLWLKDEFSEKHVKEIREFELDHKPFPGSLALYEFNVALLYKEFYKLSFPLDVPKSEPIRRAISSDSMTECYSSDIHFLKDIPPESLVSVTLRYLILVPNVVLCATVSLGKPVVAVHAGYGKPPSILFGEKLIEDTNPSIFLGHLFKDCSDGSCIMAEENRCLHVALGIAKGYKSVISNIICDSIRRYLAFAEEIPIVQSEKQIDITEADMNCRARKITPKDLIRSLEINWTGLCGFCGVKGDLAANMPQLSSFSETNTYSGLNMPQTVQEDRNNIGKKAENIYRETKCFVAKDRSWFHFRRLPVISQCAGHYNKSDTFHNRCRSNWFVNAYVIPVNKPIAGHIRFYG